MSKHFAKMLLHRKFNNLVLFIDLYYAIINIKFSIAILTYQTNNSDEFTSGISQC